MRFQPLIVLVFSASVAFAQANLWNQVRLRSGQHQLLLAFPSDTQKKSFARILREQKPKELWGCDPSEREDMIDGLRFESIPNAFHKNVVLAEAPDGCARGGQGANGAMWVIRFDRNTPVLLATPKVFSGWVFSVGPSSSHGYPDIVLGWHMSAAEAGLTYFRFDGMTYHKISTATLGSDTNGITRIVPNPKQGHQSTQIGHIESGQTR